MAARDSSALDVSESGTEGVLRGLVGRAGVPWSQRLAEIVEMMREMSRQTDPQAMVRAYAARTRRLMPTDRSVSLSRRELEFPQVRVTRFTGWTEDLNPWEQKHRLPVISGGLFADLIYGDEPKVIDDLNAILEPTDPAAPFLEGMRSLMALPNYDKGEALNMVLVLRKEPAAFDREGLPERVWMSNLFGRATHNLVLSEELKRAYGALERELEVVAEIQRSLLPRAIPPIPGLELAVHYEASRWAGGDYYDFLPLQDGRWGLLIADVSGHGTPAAVLMAITQTIARGDLEAQLAPARFLAQINHRLARHYTSDGGMFVTAFYGIFDPIARTLTYANAGHNPPLLKRCSDGSVLTLDQVGGLPLGLFERLTYDESTLQLRRGDQLVLYTDGITEATNTAGQLFGMTRLDRAISRCQQTADAMIRTVLGHLEDHTQGQPHADDQTLVVGLVS